MVLAVNYSVRQDSHVCASPGEIARNAFVKVLSVGDHHYLYDVNTDSFFQISQPVARILEGCDESCLKRDEVADAYADIKTCAATGALSSSRPSASRFAHAKECYGELVDGSIEQIILNLTDNCNMRCGYCIYSGLNENVRTHGEADMPKSVIAKAIDYYIAHSGRVEIPTLGLYGGEPTLRMPLVRYAIDRFSAAMGDRRHMISMTSNGLGLTPDVWRYFDEKRVSLLVSVDGPPEIHDRYRRRSNDKDSFALIEKNLTYGATNHPDYYRNHVAFSTTLAPPYALAERAAFFDQWPLKHERNHTVGYVDGIPVSEFAAPDVDDTDTDDEAEFSAYIDDLIAGGRGTWLQRALFQGDFLQLYKRQRTTEPYRTVYPNICRPGVRRLFVDLEGRLHLCEKVTQNAPIGDVWSGIDVEASYQMAEDFASAIAGKCRSCWASRYCKMCFAHVVADGYDPRTRANLCAGVRDHVERTMTAYCYVVSKNPSAFDHFKEISVG